PACLSLTCLPLPYHLFFFSSRRRHTRSKRDWSSDVCSSYLYRSGSAASALSPVDLPEQLIEQAEILHVSGITPLLSASARDTVVTAVRRAAAAGGRVSLDVNHRSRLRSPGRLAQLLAELLEHVDLLIGGPEELAL